MLSANLKVTRQIAKFYAEQELQAATLAYCCDQLKWDKRREHILSLC